MKPGSQVKCFVLGYTVRSPVADPFSGIPNDPQSIAVRKEQRKHVKMYQMSRFGEKKDQYAIRISSF